MKLYQQAAASLTVDCAVVEEWKVVSVVCWHHMYPVVLAVPQYQVLPNLPLLLLRLLDGLQPARRREKQSHQHPGAAHPAAKPRTLQMLSQRISRTHYHPLT
jgi:hypothetical protein